MFVLFILTDRCCYCMLQLKISDDIKVLFYFHHNCFYRNSQTSRHQTLCSCHRTLHPTLALRAPHIQQAGSSPAPGPRVPQVGIPGTRVRRLLRVTRGDSREERHPVIQVACRQATRVPCRRDTRVALPRLEPRPACLLMVRKILNSKNYISIEFLGYK